MSDKKPASSPDAGVERDAPCETTSIELISTQVLKTLLAEETDALNVLQDAASGDIDEEGILTRDDNGNFELLEKSSLDSLMNTPVSKPARPAQARGRPASSAPAPQQAAKEAPVRKIALDVPDSMDELELVNTTMLRVILDEKLQAEGKAPKFAIEAEDAERAAKGRADKDGGFNPYDSTKKLRR